MTYRFRNQNIAVTHSNITDPLAVDYDPRTQYIFYSDRGTKTISKFHAERHSFQDVLHSENIGERTLYWIDSSQKYLEKVYYDGTKRTSLKSVSQLDIFALALDNDAFFWSGYRPTEESTGYIYFIDRKLETSGYYVRWGTDKDYKGISLRPYQESADASPPVFQNCPDTIFVWVAVGELSSFVSWDEILLQDDNDLIASSSHVSGSEFFLGSDTVSIAARDLAGNKAWCNFSVIVYEDEIPPVISPCPDDIYVRITIPGEKEKIVTWNEPELSDNAGKANWLELNLFCFPGYVQTTPRPDNDPQQMSLTLILVTSIGGVLIVIGLVAVFLKRVLFKGGQRAGRDNSNQVGGSALRNHMYLDQIDRSKASVFSVSGGSA
ncbi:Hyalin [Holothuria leucospilota]|uniref:Hyalin n=1 Tax=Holothuria leucospilota TaxID=206669 RepID=A0A9Q1C4S9_HOLLE|nr:Hyalin [Holothuria leucospilota]